MPYRVHASNCNCRNCRLDNSLRKKEMRTVATLIFGVIILIILVVSLI